MGDPAAQRGELRVPSTYTEGRRGFGPFVEERNDRVAIPESSRASLRVWLRHDDFNDVASSGCERDSGADASSPSPPWVGATESGQGVGERGIFDSSPRDETTALIDAMSTDLASSVDCRVDFTSLIDAHAHGDPPRIDDRSLSRGNSRGLLSSPRMSAVSRCFFFPSFPFISAVLAVPAVPGHLVDTIHAPIPVSA